MEKTGGGGVSFNRRNHTGRRGDGTKEIDLKRKRRAIEYKLPRIAPHPPLRRVIAFT